MTGYGSLARTGGVSLAIGGTVFNQTALVAIATALVLTGVLLVRIGFRRGKTVTDI